MPRRSLLIATACMAVLVASKVMAQAPSIAVAVDRVTTVARAAHLAGEIAIADQAGPVGVRAIGWPTVRRSKPIIRAL